MKPSKLITIAELIEEIWRRDKVRVIIHRPLIREVRNYRYSRALHGDHTIAHLRTRVAARLSKSFKVIPDFSIVLGNGKLNPRADMHMSTARKTYKQC